MNTFCERRGDIITHEMVRVTPLRPVYGSPNFSGPVVPSDKPEKIKWRAVYKCRYCDDSGLFDQDGKPVEFHQGKTVAT